MIVLENRARRFLPDLLKLLIAILAFGNLGVLALDPNRELSQYIHDSWQTENGLPQNSVTAIVQTRDGFIWLATQEGLVRFDGINFKVFDKRNTGQIKDSNIQALMEDREGNLWFGTPAGLNKMRDGKFSLYTVADGLSSETIDVIYQDREGTLWVGTPSGLNRMSEGRFTSFTAKDGLAGDVVLSIKQTRDGSIWIGGRGGLTCLKNGSFTTYTTKDGLSDNLIGATLEDMAGNLWIATDNGLSKLKDGKFTTYTTRDGLSNNSILSLSEDRAGNLWIGTQKGGLDCFRNGRFSSYTSKDGLTDDEVDAIYEDSEGSLWIGTNAGGLNRLKDGSFITYSARDGLSNENVRSIYEDRDGTIWIATRVGLNRLRDGRFSVYTTKDGLVDDSILSIYQDRAGVLWFGTRDGLSRLKDGKFTSLTTKDGLPDGTVLSLLEDRRGALWIGTGEGGLCTLADGKLTTYTSKGRHSDDAVYSICEGEDGDLWLGTDGGGLKRFKDGEFSAYTTNDGLSNNIVMCVHRDKAGDLWIGTMGGLNRLKDGKFTSCTVANGLFDDVVYQICEDASDNFWMSCDKGIYRTSRTALEAFAEGRIASITSVSYGTADGMKSRECNGGFQPAGCRSRDGRLWFPTIRGIAVIDPAKLRTNTQPPPVVIEQVFIDNEPATATDKMRLPPGKAKFEFRYAGLSYLAPEKVRFKYKLEGFDKDWVDAGDRREAFYTNIAPGSYRFRVMASNNDGVWNEKGAAIEFYLAPRFYQTYWFYALGLGMALLFVFVLHRYQVRQVEAKFAAVLAERNRIAREIHDTLAQGFVGISAQLETAARLFSASPQKAIRHLDQARILVRSSLAEARRSVLDLRSQALESGDLVAALSGVAKNLTTRTPIEVRVKGDPRRLAADVENNLFRIGQEALANAVKHAEAQHVCLAIEFNNGSVLLRVQDDGRGFAAESVLASGGGHLGLVGMRERAEQMGGKLTVSSSPGGGTEIVVEAAAA